MKTILVIASLILFSAANYATHTEEATGHEYTDVEFNGSINKAMGAIHSSCPNAQGPLTYTVQTITATNGSFSSRIIFWKAQNGQGNQSSQQAPVYAGTVILNDQNKVVSVVCANDIPDYQ